MKKLCSVILALTLLLALLPAAGLAEEISDLHLTVPVPAEGMKPSDAAPALSTDDARIYAYDWRDSKGEKLTGFDSFREGETYTLTVVAASLKTFTVQTKVFVNDQSVAWENFSIDSIKFAADFTATEQKIINAFSVSVTPPAVGEHPSLDVTFTGADLEVKEIYWSKGGNSRMNETDVFEAGPSYMLWISVVPKNPSARIPVYDNGWPMVEITSPQAEIYNPQWDSYNPERLHFALNFGVLGGQTIPTLTFTGATPPAAGEKPSYEVTLAPGNYGHTGNMDKGFRKGVRWFDLTDGEPQYDDPFEGGHQYRLDLELESSAGWVFDPATTTAAVNGQPAEVQGNPKKVMVSYTFPALEKEKPANPFEDIRESDYFYDAVLWAYYAEPQVTNGMDATHFGPASTVTRGQAVTFLWRAMGCPEPANKTNPFVDVPESEYYYKAILWALEKGITIGTDDTHFTPHQTCSTAHILTFLYRTLGIGDNGWYEPAGAWAKDAGLLDGLTLAVSPEVDCPRADVVLFLYRQLAKK